MRAQQPILSGSRVEREPVRLQRQGVSAPVMRPPARHDSQQPCGRTGARPATSKSASRLPPGRHRRRRGPRPATHDQPPTGQPRQTPRRTLRSGPGAQPRSSQRSGSRSNARSFLWCRFSADPTSVTTRSTASSWVVAHMVTRTTCRSRSWRWSPEDTRAHTTVTPCVPVAGWSMRIRSRPGLQGPAAFLPGTTGRR
jgi:hypothetical protein